VNILLVGDSAGQVKLKAAQERGNIRMISEKAFLDIINLQHPLKAAGDTSSEAEFS
jgi:BRCT domain type II-containing protein